MEELVARTDVYGITDTLDTATLDVLAARLEARAVHPRFVAMTSDYLESMEIDSCQSVLEVGCGTGPIARGIARRPGFRGRITGYDLSPYLVEQANRKAQEEGLADRMEFYVANLETAEIPDQFDAVTAHTLLSHVESPEAVLRQLKKVIRPTGRIAIFDGDYSSITFGHQDAETAARFNQIIRRAIVTNASVMWNLPSLLHLCGLRIRAFLPYVLAEAGEAEYWIATLESFRRILPASGQITADETNRWVDEMLGFSQQGSFFGSCCFYSYVVEPLP